MELSEKELETMIYNATQTLEGRAFLAKRGLPVTGKFFRQVNLGDYGIADLISVSFGGREKYKPKDSPERIYRNVDIVVYELKKGSIGANAFMQAYRYIKGIKEHFIRKENDNSPKCRLLLRTAVVLIGSDIDNGDFQYLTLLPRLFSFLFKFDFSGIHFCQLEEADLFDKSTNPCQYRNIESSFTPREFIATRSIREHMTFLDDFEELNLKTSDGDE